MKLHNENSDRNQNQKRALVTVNFLLGFESCLKQKKSLIMGSVFRSFR